jgi:glycosyltransferase involved in cell wall biosynthesis
VEAIEGAAIRHQQWSLRLEHLEDSSLLLDRVRVRLRKYDAAIGEPGVASNTGGLPEVVTHGVNGLLHPPGDVEAFASSIRTLLSDEATRKRMGEAARDRAMTSFRQEALLPVWESYYERILKAPRRA